MKHLYLKRVWAIIVMIAMMLPLPAATTAETPDEEITPVESIAEKVLQAEEKPVDVAEEKTDHPAGAPEIIRMKDLNEFDQIMNDLEKIYKDAGNQGEDPDAIERFCNSRVLLKGVPNFDGFQPLQVILDPYGIYVIQFDGVEEAERFIEKQSADPAVIWAEQDAIVYSNEPNENVEEEAVYPDMLWEDGSVQFVHAEDLIDYIYNGTTSNGESLNREVIVAVVDTGCELTHSFLKDRIVNPPEGTISDYIQYDNDPSDEDGHGTHVAGIVVKCTGNENQTLNVRILPVRALGNVHGSSSIYRIAAGICYAANQGADVINLSLVVETEYDSIEDAVRYAIDEKNCVICAAAGNGHRNTMNSEPANSFYPGVITVSALERTGADWTIAYQSNYGESVDIAAPGIDIISSVLNNGFDFKSGTSMAAPIVSAAAAMIRQIYPGLSPAAVEEILIAATVDAGDPGHDIFYGYGNLQMQKILEFEPQLPIVTRNPESVAAECGTEVVFLAAGEGTGVTYRWEYRENETVEWRDVPDEFANCAEYAFPAVDEMDGYEYRCRIENYWGCAHTEPALLTVTPRTGSGPFDGGTITPGLAWELDDEFTLHIIGGGELGWYDYGEAPWFFWRNQIKAIDFGSGISEIKPNAFAGLSKLTSVVIPESVEYLDRSCFYNCDALRWVVFPEGLSGIDYDAFMDCDALTDVFFKGETLPIWSDDVSDVFPSGTRIHMSYAGPIILNQTLDVDAIEGEQTTLVLEAIGADPTYQWYYRTSAGSDWQMITDEEGTKAEYTVIPSREMDGWQYRCFIQDMIGETYSDVIPLYVAYKSPVITGQPGLWRGTLGTKTRISVVADGGGLRYQWEYRQADSNEWRPAEEASGTSANLIIGFTEDKVGNAYRCVVSNVFGTAVSRTVTLTVWPSLKPFQEKEIKPISPIIIDPPIIIRPLSQMRAKDNTLR